MTDSTLKVCTSCGVPRTLGMFYAHAKAKDGLQSQCKRCMKDAAAKRYKDHRLDILYAARVKYRLAKWKVMKGT